MNYDDYVKHQIEGPGMIKKPLRYRQGERRAIDWFFMNVPKDRTIFDVGCGTGAGLTYLKQLGYLHLSGIELNPKKAEICTRKGLYVFTGDILNFHQDMRRDIIWTSHSFEHMLYPEAVLRRFQEIADFIFMILPYPDTGPKEVHCASDEIGTRKEDYGQTVLEWFRNRDMKIIQYKFDTFRENEIWLKMKSI